MVVFAMGWMGYDAFPPPLNDWREVGRRVVKVSLYYLLGVWRERFQLIGEEYDRARARAELWWIDCFRGGLAVALAETAHDCGRCHVCGRCSAVC